MRSQLATARGDREEEIEAELAELAQLRKEAREAAAEIHREGRSIELERVRSQQELSDARGEIADAKATILKQSDKIRELERGYSLKPNPALASLKIPDAGEILNRLKAQREEEEASQPKRKKSLPPLPTLTNIEAILEMIKG